MTLTMNKKILIHTCCAPCLAYIFEILKQKFEIFEMTVYFFNLNIQPSKEYKNRKNALIEFCRLNKIELIVDESEGFDDWFDGLLQDKNTVSLLRQNRDLRCSQCYEMRLAKTAQKAKELDIKNFTSTLLYSIYQNHDNIKNIGTKIAKNFSLSFYYEDFRKGWKQGFEIYKKTGLYRQNYCGCIFSEYERFWKQSKTEDKKV